MRARRIGPLLRMIEHVHRTLGHVEIIDIGGTDTYWKIVPAEYLTAHGVNVTVVNLPGETMPDDFDRFRFVAADGCDLSGFPDRAFHIAHSNSVIEHVGDWPRMALFAKEVARVADGYFVQTPNFWFPLEPHCMTPFFHWLPVPTRAWLVRRFQLGHWPRAETIDEAMRTVESARLLNKRMLQELFPRAQVVTERFLGVAKSHIAIAEPHDLAT